MLALSVAAPPLGVFLVLRRMSLMSDVLQHGVLPGIALGAAVGGLSVWAMGIGGILAGLIVATDNQSPLALVGAGFVPVANWLGGAVFLFLRGIANQSTRGCYLLEPDLALLDGLEQLLDDQEPNEA